MSSAVESKPFFKSRALQLGISEANVDTLERSNLGTYGSFAFLVPYNAASTDLEQLKTSLTAILGSEPSVAEMSLWRRLQFDSHTHVLSDARARIERTESTEPRRIPVPEKAERLDSQRKRLTHLEITPELEPSYALIDEVAQMIDDGILKHITVDKCTSRKQEMSQIRKEPAIKIDSSGQFKLAEKAQPEKVDVSTDLALRVAFQRRSLAFDQCNLVSYVEHERWVNHLFSHLARQPPPGYAPVSTDQILQADRELWTTLANECRSGLQMTAAGVKPVEQAITRVMSAPHITYAILPLPASSGSNQRKRQQEKRKANDPSDEDKKKARTDNRGKGKGAGKGKGKDKGGKSKTSSAFDIIPELKGMWAFVRGNPVCVKYNLGTCPETQVKPGEWCSRGIHVCCVPKCFEVHSMKEHKS